jgi:hypothetical protein
MITVMHAALLEAMRSGETPTQAEAGALRHLSPKHRFHRSLPQPPLCRLAPVMHDIAVLGAHDSKALIGIAERQRYRVLHERLALLQRLGLGQWNVPRGHIEVINGRQHELERTALGAHHQIDTACIPVHAFVQLRGRQQQHRDRGRAEGEQKQDQHGVPGTRPNIRKAEGGQVHSFTGSVK